MQAQQHTWVPGYRRSSRIGGTSPAKVRRSTSLQRVLTATGLSILFFILSLTGNATYGASILCHSTEKQYLMTNLPWLIGSLGTMVEDATIFAQFRIYSNPAAESAVT